MSAGVSLHKTLQGDKYKPTRGPQLIEKDFQAWTQVGLVVKSCHGASCPITGYARQLLGLDPESFVWTTRTELLWTDSDGVGHSQPLESWVRRFVTRFDNAMGSWRRDLAIDSIINYALGEDK